MIDIPQIASNAKDFPQVDKTARKIIAYKVLHNASNQDAFRLFHPEYLDCNGRLNAAGQQDCKFFFNYGKNREYIEAYTKTIETFFSGGNKRKAGDEPLTDKKKDKALSKLVSDCLDAIDSNESLDPEILKDFVTMAKALGVLKEEQERIEPARRYLPARCRTECAYRLFVESHIEGGDIISECDHCRTRKFAEEQGWKFDPTKNLALPIENNNNG